MPRRRGQHSAANPANRDFSVQMLERRVLLSAPFAPPADPRIVSNLDASWRFQRSDVAGAQASAFDDSGWSSIALPHTWNALDGQDGGNNYYRGIGWYRRHVTPDAAVDTGKRLYLKFDGANSVTDLYVSGTLVGEHKGGYAAFGWDVTSMLIVGADNVIAVKVNNVADSNLAPLGGDYTQFGGIYRHVNLIATDPAQVALQEFVPPDTSANPVGPTVGYWLNTPGVYLTPTNVSASSADLKITTDLRNDGATARSLSVVSDVVDAAGNVVTERSSTQNIAAGANVNVVQTTSVANPHLWNGVIDPYLYKVYVRVLDGSSVIDVVQQPVGFRSYTITAAGTTLNGQPYDLHGVNFHQDRINKGWAISDADQQQDVALVQDMGATFVRLSHYQHPPLTYDLLDKYGIGSWSEVPINGTNNAGVSGTTAFLDNVKQQLQEMIRQNYNHPGILVWGLYNELSDNATTQAVVTALDNLAHQEDPTRLTTGATNQSPSAGVSNAADLMAFNRYDGWYNGTYNDVGPYLDNARSAFPTLPIGLSEYGAGGSINQHQDNPTGVNPSGLFHPEEYQNQFHEAFWTQIKSRPYLWTKLVWNMFDFAADGRGDGDTPGRNDKGMITFDRVTKKDVFYWYKSNWSADPVLYITSRRYAVRTNQTTDIKIYSNLDSVTLTLNGNTIGTLTAAAAPDEIFKWPGVQLKGGANVVSVTGVRNGQTYTDTVTWTFTGLPHIAALTGTPVARINFQPSASPNFPGYSPDTGSVYSARTGGLTYGWNADNAANTRDRTGTTVLQPPPDARYATFVHTNRNGAFVWELAVPNGTYDVHLVAGDAGFTDSQHSYDLEGLVALSGAPTSSAPWVESTVRVTVTDGRLTLSNDASGANQKIDYIDVNAADVTAPLVQSASFDSNVAPHAVSIRFSENVGASFGAGDVTLQNLTTGQTIPDAQLAPSYTGATNTATLTKTAGGLLPDGAYRATVHAGSVTDAAGNALAADFTFDFFVLAGDANHDRTVDLTDFTILATNFNQNGRGFAQGNFNYDAGGTVDLTDFTILAANFNQTIAPAPGPAAARSAPSVAPAAAQRASLPIDVDRSHQTGLVEVIG